MQTHQFLHEKDIASRCSMLSSAIAQASPDTERIKQCTNDLNAYLLSVRDMEIESNLETLHHHQHAGTSIQRIFQKHQTQSGHRWLSRSFLYAFLCAF